MIQESNYCIRKLKKLNTKDLQSFKAPTNTQKCTEVVREAPAQCFYVSAVHLAPSWSLLLNLYFSRCLVFWIRYTLKTHLQECKSYLNDFSKNMKVVILKRRRSYSLCSMVMHCRKTNINMWRWKGHYGGKFLVFQFDHQPFKKAPLAEQLTCDFQRHSSCWREGQGGCEVMVVQKQKRLTIQFDLMTHSQFWKRIHTHLFVVSCL